MIGKICSKCEKWKPFGDFHKNSKNKSGFASACKECENERGKIKYQKKKESILARQNAYRNKNPEKHRAQNKLWYERNKKIHSTRGAKWRRENPEKCRAYTQKWERANPEKNRERGRRQRQTPRGKVEAAIRSGIHRAISSNDKRGNKTFEILGYSPQQLMKHLERQFVDGMSWENHGRGENCWHIDHIVPVSAHNYSTLYDFDFKACWSLKNLRPLWEKENLAKNAKLLSPFQPSLALAEPLAANDNEKVEG